jgi:hypothetical protein
VLPLSPSTRPPFGYYYPGIPQHPTSHTSPLLSIVPYIIPQPYLISAKFITRFARDVPITYVLIDVTDDQRVVPSKLLVELPVSRPW